MLWKPGKPGDAHPHHPATQTPARLSHLHASGIRVQGDWQLVWKPGMPIPPPTQTPARLSHLQCIFLTPAPGICTTDSHRDHRLNKA